MIDTLRKNHDWIVPDDHISRILLAWIFRKRNPAKGTRCRNKGSAFSLCFLPNRDVLVDEFQLLTYEDTGWHLVCAIYTEYEIAFFHLEPNFAVSLNQ